MPVDLLIVDDSSAIRKILQRILQKTSLPIGEIYEAADGVEALAFLKQKSVGLILSDINMPNMDGLQLLTELKSQEVWKNIPVVMITTEGSQTRVLEALERGAAGYVRKPFTPDQIKERLSEIL